MILGLFENYAQLFEVAGVWLAAIATFLAASVALYVANRANRQYLVVNAEPMVIVTPGVPNSQQPVFSVSATNAGLRPAIVQSIGMKSRFPRYNAFLLVGSRGDSPMPVTLSDGETASWRFPEVSANGESWYLGIAEHALELGWLGKTIYPWSVRFYAHTSLGKTFYARKSKSFREKLREQIAEVKAK